LKIHKSTHQIQRLGPFKSDSDFSYTVLVWFKGVYGFKDTTEPKAED
jgi:hypothetical protein